MIQPSAYFIKVAPTAHADFSGDLREGIYRGIIEEVGQGILEDTDDMERWGPSLKTGNTVYYKGGIKIENSVYLKPHDYEIIAFEPAP